MIAIGIAVTELFLEKIFMWLWPFPVYARCRYCRPSGNKIKGVLPLNEWYMGPRGPLSFPYV